MAPLTIDEWKNKIMILLKNFLKNSDFLEMQIILPTVENREYYLGAKRIFSMIIKLLPFYETSIGGVGLSSLERRKFRNLSAGFFMTTLIFASMIRLGIPIIENAGNDGEIYKSVPFTTNGIINGQGGYKLLKEILNELSKTWSFTNYLDILHIFARRELHTFNPILIRFIEHLLDSGIIRHEQFNELISTYFINRGRSTWDEVAPTIRFGTVPGSPEEESFFWIRKIQQHFNLYDFNSFSDLLIQFLLKYNNVNKRKSIVSFFTSIIKDNEDKFIDLIEEQDILIVIISTLFWKHTLNQPDDKQNEKTIVNVFTLAMMEVERYILRTLPPENSFGLTSQMRMYNSSRLRRNRQF